MKKIIASMVIGLIFVAGTACGGDSKKMVSTPPIHTNSSANTAEKRAACVEVANQIQIGLNAMLEGVNALSSADEAQIRSFLATAKTFVTTSIEAVQTCSEFAPAEAAIALKQLTTLRDTIDSVSNSY
jgi:hypothetical protein